MALTILDPYRSSSLHETLFAPYTVVVYRGAMAETESRRGERVSGMPRASISFPPEVYKGLEDLALKKKVSIAWIVREAVEKYLADEFPLFGTSLLKGGDRP